MSLPQSSCDGVSLCVFRYSCPPNAHTTARRWVSSSSKCSRHCASLGILFFRVLAPLRVVGYFSRKRSSECSRHCASSGILSSKCSRHCASLGGTLPGAVHSGTLPWCSHKSSSARRGLQHTASRRRRSAKSSRSLRKLADHTRSLLWSDADSSTRRVGGRSLPIRRGLQHTHGESAIGLSLRTNSADPLTMACRHGPSDACLVGLIVSLM